jgi:hypothetical protein
LRLNRNLDVPFGIRIEPKCTRRIRSDSPFLNRDQELLMHATIRRYEGFDQSRTDELTKKVGESLTPRLSGLPGFGGYYLIEAGNGVLASPDEEG